MRDILTVAKFTISDMLKRKSFIISTIIIMLLIVVGVNIPNIMAQNADNSAKEKIAIVDQDNLFEGNLSILNNMELNYDFKISNDSLKKLKKDITNKKIDSALIINKDYQITYLVENILFENTIPEDILTSLKTIYTNMQIEKLGLTEEDVKALNPNFTYELKQTDEQSEGNIVITMLISVVLFYAIYFCAYQVSNSITTEKTSKIIETLVTSTSPKTIVIGKTLGIGFTGLLQMWAIILVAILSVYFFLPKDILNILFDMSNITLFLGIMTIIYFLLGYLVYAFLYALTGSTVAKPEDVQSSNTPVALLAVASFYLSYFTMTNPSSNLNVFASIFPLSSPFCMPFRIMMGLASVKEIILSLVILIITIIIIAKISIKIYSSAILNYGNKMSLKDILTIWKS